MFSLARPKAVLSRLTAGRARSAVAPQPAPPPEQPLAVGPADALWRHVPYSAEEMSGWTREDLQRHRTGDAWLDNMLLNKFEFATGVSRLESLPFRFSVPFVLCNARCDFCSAWLVQGKPMPIELIDRLEPVMPYLAEIDLVGWGEPLIHPQFAQILQTLQDRADDRAHITLTTNGAQLKAWIPRLLAAKVRHFAISIHAATAATHEDMMGLAAGTFDKVTEAIAALTSRRAEEPKLVVGMVFIVTRQNIGEIPQFLEMAERLGVDSVFLRTLQGRSAEDDGLDYHRLPPYLHPDFAILSLEAVAAIAAARARGRLTIEAAPETWSTSVYPEDIEAEMLARPVTSREERRVSKSLRRTPVEDSSRLPTGRRLQGAKVRDDYPNPYGRTTPLGCPSPYTALYINGFDRQLTPCCYMGVVEGHEPNYLREGASFDQVWNAPAMVEVRRTLHEGPLMEACLKCPFFF